MSYNPHRRPGRRLGGVARVAELNGCDISAAPAGAGVAFMPIYLWLITGNDVFRQWPGVMAWTLFIAALMISSLPTYSWSSIRIRPAWRLFALAGVALFGAALIVAPWPTLLALAGVYLLMIPVALANYARLKRRRATSRSRA